jgi:hypothetical protein
MDPESVFGSAIPKNPANPLWARNRQVHRYDGGIRRRFAPQGQLAKAPMIFA